MKKCATKTVKAAIPAPAKADKKPARKYVTFQYVGAPGRHVAISGCFNDWRADQVMTDKKGNGEYSCRIQLAPGEYQYKFVVDGEWCLDTSNPRFVPNEFGSLNSVVVVE